MCSRGPVRKKWDHVDPLVPPRLFLFFATPESLCVLTSRPGGDRPENSVRNGDLLLAESVLQVVVVGVGGSFFVT